MKKASAVLASLAGLLFASATFADQPRMWQMDLQEPGSPVMAGIRWFEHYTLWFIVPITLFVLALLVIVVLRFRAGANPVPSKVSHNTLIEVIWTVGPVLVLLMFAIPSFNLLNQELIIPEKPDVTVKATASQWQWNYEYPSDKSFNYDSYLLKEADRAGANKQDTAKYPRLLAVDNEMVVPVNKVVRVLVTAVPTDVIHAFAMPSFGVKIDAIPGRLNETWFKAEREGLYYGQCSELCGKDHAFMPIAIRVVSDAQYSAWLSAAGTDLKKANQQLMAEVDGPKTVDVAQNTAQ